jgi:hypothetical protein
MSQYDVAIIGGGAAGLSAAPTTATSTTDHELSTRRLNTMRLGYAFMGVGLAIVKWPILVQSAASLPVSEGVVACLLTAMSLLAFLGLRYPIRMLPILLFEVLWKIIWIAAVALPHLVAHDIDAATSQVLVNCSLVVVIIAVIPWPYVWRRFVQAPGDAWRQRGVEPDGAASRAASGAERKPLTVRCTPTENSKTATGSPNTSPGTETCPQTPRIVARSDSRMSGPPTRPMIGMMRPTSPER